MSDGELLIYSEKTDLDLYCPGCAEFILHLGVGSRDDIRGFEAYCPRCDVALFEHTAVVAEGDVDDDRDNFRDVTVDGWRQLVTDDESVYLSECEYQAEAFGWEIPRLTVDEDDKREYDDHGTPIPQPTDQCDLCGRFRENHPDGFHPEILEPFGEVEYLCGICRENGRGMK